MSGFLFGEVEYKREPTSWPLAGPPPLVPSDPVLVLGLMTHSTQRLEDVYRSVLVFSSSSQLKKQLPTAFDENVLLNILQCLDGLTLLNMCSAFRGSVFVDCDSLFNSEGDGEESQIRVLQEQRFQSIVVADYCMPELALRDFVREQYESGVNVVIMAIEGLFNLGYMSDFEVNWNMLAYTKRTVHLTNAGKRLLSEAAFPFESRYTKSHFVTGDGEELFAELIEEEEEETDESDDNADDTVPTPQPGSPVITYMNENRCCISYFGFVNPLDVSYGAIIHRLCYAGQYNERA